MGCFAQHGLSCMMQAFVRMQQEPPCIDALGANIPALQTIAALFWKAAWCAVDKGDQADMAEAATRQDRHVQSSSKGISACFHL